MSGLVPYWPWAALALLVFTVALGLRWAVVHVGLARRPLLLGAIVLAALPALYLALVWTGLVAEAYVRFGRPSLALLALPAMAFVAIRLSRHGSRSGRIRTWTADALVSVAVLASAMAAAEPELGRPLDRLTVIAVVDRSRSIDLVVGAEVRISRELSFAEQDMREDDRVGVVVFAAEAATEDPPRRQSAVASPQRVDLGRDGTDIAAGIKRALAEVPADSAARLVLLSDGVATRGDAMAAAAAAVASDIPIDVVALEQQETPDVRVVSLRLPSRATEGETMGMRVVIASPVDAEIELRIKRDGQLVRRLAAKVAAGEDVLAIPELAASSGLHRYDVEVSAVDPSIDRSAEDNVASAFVRVRGPARALVVDGDPSGSVFVASALRAAGFHVEEGTTSAVPGDIAAMATFDLIVFGDVPAHDLAPAQIEALASYVRDLGGGLLLTGGDRSMGPGGYGHTPLEEVSPVSFDLKQERRRASLAEVIAIDISGSMGMNVGGHTKLELANEAAARAASLLGAGDHLGVVHVDTAPRWAVPLAPVKDTKAIEDAIRRVGPGGGGIFVDVALQEAYAALGKAQVNLKHVLLFADGDDAENITAAVPGWVSAAARRGITTSVVSLGRGHDSPALEDLSRRGSGRFYIVEDATRLPTVFAQETILASRSAIVEEPFRAALASSGPVSKGVSLAEAPPLEGYVVTIAKPRATMVLAGPEDDPLLATWSAGVGRAAAFTSDLKDRWGGAWTGWQGAARLVAQIGRHIARSEDDQRVRLEADASGGQLHLRATVVDDDGRLQTFRRLTVTVGGPDGFKRELALEAAGAGTYTAAVPLGRPGAYIAVARDEASGQAVATTGAALSAGEELRPTGSDLATLARVAELTGGKRRDTLAGIFRDRAAKRFAYRDITIEVLMMAAFALLLAVAARRLAIPEASYAWLGRAARWRPWRHVPEGPPAPGGATAETTLATLLQSKQAGSRRERTDAIAAGSTTGPTTGPTTQPPAGAADSAASMAERLAAQRSQGRASAAQPRTQGGPAPGRPAPTAAQRMRPTAGPSRAPASPTPQGPASGRPLTAAEILLARRKQKKR